MNANKKKKMRKLAENMNVAKDKGLDTYEIANQIKKFDSIGIDLVAMCVNDLIVQGAKPLFFLDYLAVNKLNIRKAKEIISGIVKGTEISGCSLIGGETAELPDIYKKNTYDLAGFALGAVEKDKILPRSNIAKKDIIIALKSSGIHSNGFSLVRKIIKHRKISLYDKILNFTPKNIGEYLLTPTKIYVKSILHENDLNNIKACAHITGGGLIDNLPRVLPSNLSAVIYAEEIRPLPIFHWLKETGNISTNEMLKTFNCGVGFCLISNKKNIKNIKKIFNKNYQPYQIGFISREKSKVKTFGKLQW